MMMSSLLITLNSCKSEQRAAWPNENGATWYTLALGLICKSTSLPTVGKAMGEQYLITSVKDISRIVTKSKSRDDDQKKKYSDMIYTLIEDYGYNESSAEEILTYASNNLWRDS